MIWTTREIHARTCRKFLWEISLRSSGITSSSSGTSRFFCFSNAQSWLCDKASFRNSWCRILENTAIQSIPAISDPEYPRHQQDPDGSKSRENRQNDQRCQPGNSPNQRQDDCKDPDLSISTVHQHYAVCFQQEAQNTKYKDGDEYTIPKIVDACLELDINDLNKEKKSRGNRKSDLEHGDRYAAQKWHFQPFQTLRKDQ